MRFRVHHWYMGAISAPYDSIHAFHSHELHLLTRKRMDWYSLSYLSWLHAQIKCFFTPFQTNMLSIDSYQRCDFQYYTEHHTLREFYDSSLNNKVNDKTRTNDTACRPFKMPVQAPTVMLAILYSYRPQFTKYRKYRIDTKSPHGPMKGI